MRDAFRAILELLRQQTKATSTRHHVVIIHIFCRPTVMLFPAQFWIECDDYNHMSPENTKALYERASEVYKVMRLSLVVCRSMSYLVILAKTFPRGRWVLSKDERVMHG